MKNVTSREPGGNTKQNKMKWTFDKPDKPGNYWYRPVKKALPGISAKPKILYVNSNLCVPQLTLNDFKVPVSVDQYPGQWAGPIKEPGE